MSRHSLSLLSQYCFGTAEAEVGAGCESDIYVEMDVIEDIMSMLPGSPRLLVGHKGNGKTLLMKNLERILRDQGNRVLYLKPSDLIDKSSPESEDPAVLKSFYFRAIVMCVARKLGAELPSLIGSNAKVLRDIARNDGVCDDDCVEWLVKMFSNIGGIITQTEGDLKEKFLPSETSPNKVFRSVEDNLRRSDKPFYLMIDEPDDVGTSDIVAIRIWGLLNACQEFAMRVRNARCLISLRTEIWSMMSKGAVGGKNYDHFKTLVLRLDPTDDEIGEIINKRFSFVVSQMNEGSNDLLGNFFEGLDVELPPPAKDERRPWLKYLIKVSGYRPRAAIQYLNRLASHAISRKRPLITSEDVRECAAAFSEERIQQISREYEHDFPDAINVYKTFAQLPFEIPTEEVKAHLEKVIGTGHIVLRGRQLNRTRQEDVFLLWSMLYETAFLNPYIPDSNERKEYRHVLYQDDERLVSVNNYYEMRKYNWEVHPAFRSYLCTLLQEEIRRVNVLKKLKQFEQNPNFYRKKHKRDY